MSKLYCPPRWFGKIARPVSGGILPCSARTPNADEQTIAPDNCFCLNLLNKNIIAYLAAVHPDHGMPLYRESALRVSGAAVELVVRRRPE